MTYTVVWLGPAQNHLADIWISASDRVAVSHAGNLIDQLLRIDPYNQSEALFENARLKVVPPLAVTFDVSDLDCLVTVWAVWRCP